MTGYEQGGGSAGGIFLEEGAQAGGEGGNHAAGASEEAGVAEVAGVVLMSLVWGGGFHV